LISAFIYSISNIGKIKNEEINEAPDDSILDIDLTNKGSTIAVGITW